MRPSRSSFQIIAALSIAVGAAHAQSGLPPRDEWQRAPAILAAMNISSGQRVADVAAGTGYLTKFLAGAVGKTGRVFAVDVDDGSLRTLRQLVAHDSLTNVDVITGTETDPKLPGSLDGAVILNSYHEMTKHQAMLEAIRTALRPGALLVVVDNAALSGWFTARDDQASHHALDPKYAVDELRAAGFEIVSRQDAFIVEPYAQWMIVAKRP